MRRCGDGRPCGRVFSGPDQGEISQRAVHAADACRRNPDAVLIAYVLLGLIFGIVGGMGLGGGIVLIPALTLLMSATQHVAQGMTLAAYLPMAVFALVSHIRQKNVRLKQALFITLFGCAGGAAGYFLASVIDADVLRKVFAVFLIIAALLRIWRQMISPMRAQKRQKSGTKPPIR